MLLTVTGAVPRRFGLTGDWTICHSDTPIARLVTRLGGVAGSSAGRFGPGLQP
jgi:acyl dehydratase